MSSSLILTIPTQTLSGQTSLGILLTVEPCSLTEIKRMSPFSILGSLLVKPTSYSIPILNEDSVSIVANCGLLWRLALGVPFLCPSEVSVPSCSVARLWRPLHGTLPE